MWISGHCHVHMRLQCDLNLGTNEMPPIPLSGANIFKPQATAMVLWPTLPHETMRHLGRRKNQSHPRAPGASCQPVQCHPSYYTLHYYASENPIVRTKIHIFLQQRSPVLLSCNRGPDMTGLPNGTGKLRTISHPSARSVLEAFTKFPMVPTNADRVRVTSPED